MSATPPIRDAARPTHPKSGMPTSDTIEIKEITRVEGHGNLSVRIADGEITRLELQIVESPRFFESFVRGKRFDDVPQVVCRICGICSVAHTSAAVKAIEAAAAIVPSEQTILLRKLILFGEQIQSHVLHLYFLAVPDYLGVGSVIPLAKTHPEVVKRALRMKKLANDLCAVIGGRHIHPISYRVGGFSHLPAPSELQDIKARLESARSDLDETVKLFEALSIPDYRRDTEYLALQDADANEYAFYDGRLVSSMDASPTEPKDYRRRVIESVVAHSTAKHSSSPLSESYAVGALARFNINADRLHPVARQAAKRLGLQWPCSNPFHNNTAQLVETIHCVESAIELADRLLSQGTTAEPIAGPKNFGRGVGIVEAPRGVLIHEYDLDEKGRVRDANLIIPTNQNLANIEADLRGLVPPMLAQQATRDEITGRLEMLVRAYDPCISCATHFLDIDWVES